MGEKVLARVRGTCMNFFVGPSRKIEEKGLFDA
jgi:hypothetical protein